IDLEEAIISVNEHKQITKNIGRDIELDLSEEDFEYERLMYPVCMLDEYSVWRSKYNKYWNYDPQKIQFWDEFEARIINGYNGYMLPVIVMKKDNSKEAVCQVFEKVNTGGVVLTVFELLTATYASEEFDLKHHWKQIKAGFAPYRVLENVQNTDIIQAVTLLARYRNRVTWLRNNQLSDDAPPVSCKRKDMLSLSLNEFQKSADDIAKGYIKAARILAENNIFCARDLPYNTQLIPMAAILAELNDSLDTAGQKQKLMRWFWCGVFGELYGAANETRYALDLPQVIDWIKQDGPEPKTIYDANFNPSRLYTLRTRNSAAYKGIYALMLNSGLRDWLSNAKIDLHNYFSERIDIHHIFPVVWCEKNSIPNDQYNSIINKTPLSGGTNRFISGDAPSRYLERLERRIGINGDEFEQILSTHLLDIHYLRNDDFAGFMASRKEMLLRMIEAATGKPIPRGDEYQEEGIYVEDDNDGAEEE
ncbi:MAG TPA: hypothetical protein PLX59_03060, partial [Candidatus Cloacimonadota bacterium]|nr:hypothetical protein [Candidatus Cloacimonadota bacterium]